MDLAIVATAFATVFVLELSDKTMVATIVLSARLRRPLAVWVGAAAALTSQMVIATAAGQLLSLLPDRVVSGIVGVLFAAGSVLLWRGQPDHEADVNVQVRPGSWRRSAATVFGVVFLAEWGDLTQLGAASLAARGSALSVFMGATAAMLTVAAIGVLAGRALLRVLPEHRLRRAATVLFGVLAFLAAVAAIRG